MSISSYEFLSILQAKEIGTAESDSKMDYPSLLESVRSSIAQNHADELAAALDNVSAAAELKSLILKYASEQLAGFDYDREGITEKIYQDMAGLGLLTPFLLDPTVEEININGYETVEIVRADKTTFLYGADAFSSPTAALDVKRLVALCNTAGTGLADARLLDMCIGAWPIVIFQKQLKDNTRKIMEVFEATGQKNGQVRGTMLYRFHIDDVERDQTGHITKICGSHQRCGCISPQLYCRLRENGASQELLKRLFPDAALEGEES